MGISRSQSLELLLEGLPSVSTSQALAAAYFDSNGQPADPGIHHDNPEFDMVIPAKAAPSESPAETPPVADSHELAGEPEAPPTPGPTASEPPPAPRKPSGRKS